MKLHVNLFTHQWYQQHNHYTGLPIIRMEKKFLPQKSTIIPLQELFETKLPLLTSNLLPKPNGLPKVKFPDF